MLKDRLCNTPSVYSRHEDSSGSISTDQSVGWSPPAGEEWRKDLPDSLRDKPLPEIVKWGKEAHSQVGALNNDFGNFKKTHEQIQREYEQTRGALAQHQDAVNKWANWYKTSVEPNWSKFEEWQASQQHAVANPGSAQAQNDVWSRWQELSPQEQAQALQGQVTQSVSAAQQQAQQQWMQMFQQQQAATQKLLADREQYYQNYLKVWQQAFEAKQKDPTLDVEKAIQSALQVYQGGVDPLELGIKLSTMDQNNANFLKQQRAIWEKEAAQKQQQAAMTPALSTGTFPTYRAPVGPPQKLSNMRDTVAKAIAEKHGMGVF
jgi:hypothetical protein